MFLTISDAAKAKLTQRLTPQTKIVLDFDDGVGPFSDAGMCTLDVAFNIILCESDQITNDFDKKIMITLCNAMLSKSMQCDAFKRIEL